MSLFIFLAKILIPLTPPDLISQNVVQRSERKESLFVQHLCEALQGAEARDEVGAFLYGGSLRPLSCYGCKTMSPHFLSAVLMSSSGTGEIMACLKSNLLKPNELKMYANILAFFSPRPALASSHSMISTAQVLIIFLVPFRPIYLPSSRRRSLVCPCSKQTHYAFCLLSHLEASHLHRSVA